MNDYVLDASGFVPVTRLVPDAVQEIRYHTTFNFVGAQIDGYDEPLALMTYEAASALRRASDAAVKRGYRLKIFDAYRPRRAVDHFLRWLDDPGDLRMKPYFYPNMDKSLLIERDFIARHSGHCRGSTLDVTLLEEASGRECDMGGPFDLFDERSFSAYAGDLTKTQREHRALLRGLMLDHGFRAIITEWWHYTLVDEPYPDTYFDFPIRASAVSR